MISNLTNLIAPHQRNVLLKSFVEKKRLLLHSENPEAIAALLPWREVNALISANAASEDVIVTRSGTTVPRQFYLVDKMRRLNVPALHDILRQGSSIVFNSIDRRVPRLGGLATSIERTFGAATWANGYFSFNFGGAFNQHWDLHDVFVLQLHGSKRWQTWGSPVDYPTAFDRSKIDKNAEPIDELELAPGDMLFIPRGEAHSASVSDDNSAHISFGIESPTGFDFIERLKALAATDPFIRKDLPRSRFFHSSTEHEVELKARLHALIDSVSLDAYFEFTDGQRRPYPQTSLEMPRPLASHMVHLALRRAVSLRETSRGEFTTIIGGESRKISAAAAAVLSSMFLKEDNYVSNLHAEFANRYSATEVDSALTELIRLGFLFIDANGQ